jgi:hypothetical protein
MDKKVIDLEKQKLLSDYRETFTTRSGQNVLFHLIQLSGVFSNTFQIDERSDCYASGRRSIGHDILELMNYSTIAGYHEFIKQRIEQSKAKSIVGTYFK